MKHYNYRLSSFITDKQRKLLERTAKKEKVSVAEIIRHLIDGLKKK